MNDTILTTAEVAARLRTPVGTLRYWRHLDKGPQSFRLGKRVVYRESQVTKWIDACERGTVAGGAS